MLQARIWIWRSAYYFPLFSFLIISLVAFSAYVSVRLALTGPNLEILEKAAKLKEDELNRWFAEQTQTIVTAAAEPEILDDSITLLKSRRRSGEEYEQAYLAVKNFWSDSTVDQGHTEHASIHGAADISLLTKGGIVVFSTNKKREGQYQPLQNTTTYFTPDQAHRVSPNLYESPITGKPQITFATPILDAEGRRAGAIAIDLDLEDLDQTIRRREKDFPDLRQTGETYLVGRISYVANSFLAGQQLQKPEYSEGINSRGIELAIQNKLNGTALYLNYDKVPVLGAYRWDKVQNLAILAEIRQDEVFQPAHLLAKRIFLIGLSSTCAITSFLLLVGKRPPQRFKKRGRGVTVAGEDSVTTESSIQ